MAFPIEILRMGVGLANTFTKGAQDKITHEAWIGQSISGPLYAPPISLDCAVDKTIRQMPLGAKGEPITIVATLTFPYDVPPNGTPGRKEPIDPRDRITLADGTTGPIVSSGGYVDPGTHRPLAPIVMLGAR
jgi:hypothetical protein